MASLSSEKTSSFRRKVTEAGKDVKNAFKTLARSSSRPPHPTSTPRQGRIGTRSERLSIPNEVSPALGGFTHQIPVAGSSSVRPPWTPSHGMQRATFESEGAPAYIFPDPKPSPTHPSGEPCTLPEPLYLTQILNPTAIPPMPEPITYSSPSHTSQLQALPGTTPGPLHGPFFASFPQPIVHPPSTDTGGHQALATVTQSLPHNSSFASMPEPYFQAEANELPSWYSGIRATLSLIERAPDAVLPLKSAVAAVNRILDVYDDLGDNRQDFARFAERAKLVYEVLRSSPPDPPQEFKGRRDGLERALTHLATALENKLNRSALEWVAHNKEEDRQETVRLVRELNFSIEIAILDVSVRNGTLILKVVEAADWLKDRRAEQYEIREPKS